ncbi:MAG: DUF1949 domain-containing protein [Gemmatimonadales bacterium]|nr:MAG: DUF1949 domain-containing protein [Gemmatimonadales bacterium]
MPQDGYEVPSGFHRVEEVIRGSRFITTVDRARSEEEARRHIDAVRGEFADATHNCWAYVAGPPGDTARIGMSDDGEPHGTAGRPMLETLLHGEVGEICAVVTRYYGGTKLGRGGLGRAYAGGVNLALASLPTILRVDRTRVWVEVAYPAVDPLLRHLDELGAVKEEEVYGARVRLLVAVPDRALDDLIRRVADWTAGDGWVEKVRPRP